MPNVSPRQNGGLYISTESKQDLIEALEKTLGCPMLSERDPGDFGRAPR